MDRQQTIAASEKAGDAAACGRYAARPCSLHESAFELLCTVFDYFESRMPQPHPDAPGHSHFVEGHWDSDGRPCQWCATWKKVRRLCTENTALTLDAQSNKAGSEEAP